MEKLPVRMVIQMFLTAIFNHSLQYLVALTLTVLAFLANLSAENRVKERRLAKNNQRMNASAPQMNTVKKKGNVKSLVINTMLNLLNILIESPLVFCSTNSDCEYNPAKPVCKEFLPGLPRICQSVKTCPKSCLPTQFCTPRGRCSGKKEEKGGITRMKQNLLKLEHFQSVALIHLTVKKRHLTQSARSHLTPVKRPVRDPVPSLVMEHVKRANTAPREMYAKVVGVL